MSGNRNDGHGSQTGLDRGTWGRGRGGFRGRGRGRGWGANAPNPASSISSRERESAPVTGDMHRNQGHLPRSAPQISKDPLGGRRRMDLMASVSRSSGLEKDGDDLKNYNTQEEYRNFIQEKVDFVFKNHSRTVSESEDNKKKRRDAQENILILFRKLREGVSSTNRNDAFALETYQTSLFLSVLFDSPKQTVGIIPHLLPVRFEEPPRFKSPGIFVHTVLVSLLHHLVEQYPSQSRYHQQLDSTPKEFLPPDTQTRKWLDSLAKSLRTRNFAKFATLADKSSVQSVLQSSLHDRGPSDISASSQARNDLGHKAVLHLLQALRKKAADTTWNILRAAYRELTVDKTTNDTATWLSRSLCFQSLLDYDPDIDVENWLAEKLPLGHVRRKEGVDGRWIICKIR